MKITDAKGSLIANRIRTKRRSKGMSLTELHKLSGLPFIVCCDVESKARSLTDYELEKIAAALGVSMQWLRTGRD